MNKRETVDIVFIAAVIIVLAGAFIYVNLPSDEEEATDEATADETESTEEGGDVVESQATYVGYAVFAQDGIATECC